MRAVLQEGLTSIIRGRHGMTESMPFLDLVRTSFPVEPLPTNFFWAQGNEPLNRDIAQELGSRISGVRG